MAIIDNPGFGLRASGNLGGICYYISRGRQVVRTAKPATPATSTKQVIIQGYLTLAVTAWQTTLSQAQRDAWREYASRVRFRDRLGRLRNIPAYNLFVKFFIRASNLGQTPISDPPADHIVAGFTSYYSDWVDALSYFRALPWLWFGDNDSDGFEWWMAGPFDYEGRQAQENEFYFEKYKAGTGITVSGTKVHDKYYWHRIRWVMNDGRHGNWIQWQLKSA